MTTLDAAVVTTEAASTTSTSTTIPPECPAGYVPAYSLFGGVEITLPLGEFVGCQKLGYVDEAPTDAWVPETCTFESSTTTNPFGLETTTCEDFLEMWSFYEIGREAMACNLFSDKYLFEEFIEDYAFSMQECAELTFPGYFWVQHGPGPALIPVEDLDR